MEVAMEVAMVVAMVVAMEVAMEVAMAGGDGRRRGQEAMAGGDGRRRWQEAMAGGHGSGNGSGANLIALYANTSRSALHLNSTKYAVATTGFTFVKFTPQHEDDSEKTFSDKA